MNVITAKYLLTENLNRKITDAKISYKLNSLNCGFESAELDGGNKNNHFV